MENFVKFSRILFAVALCLVVNQVHAAGSSGLRKKANYLGSKAAIYGITALASLQTAWALESDYPRVCECSDTRNISFVDATGELIEFENCMEFTCREESCLSLSNYALKLTEVDGQLLEIPTPVGDLEAGDKVLSKIGKNKVFSEVSYISHMGASVTDFISIKTESGTVSLTPKHRLFVSYDQSMDAVFDIKAEDLKFDFLTKPVFLLGPKGAEQVVAFEEHKELGYTNPVTKEGTIVLSSSKDNFHGYEVSCYSMIWHPASHLAYKAHRILSGGETRFEGQTKWWEKCIEAGACYFDASISYLKGKNK